MEHLRYFEPYKQAKDLIVFDRGYPSKALIKYLDSSGFKYPMRLQKSFNAEIDNSHTKYSKEFKEDALRIAEREGVKAASERVGIKARQI